MATAVAPEDTAALLVAMAAEVAVVTAAAVVMVEALVVTECPTSAQTLQNKIGVSFFSL